MELLSKPEKAALERSKKRSSGIGVDVLLLSEQVQQLSVRVSSLEMKLRRSKYDNCTPGGDNSPKVKKVHEIIVEGRKNALATVDHCLISNRPRNEGICTQLIQSTVVLRRYHFATVQFLVMLAAVIGLLVMIVIKFDAAKKSVGDDYKPYKVDGKDEYYRNKDLNYSLPLHYLWFQLAVSEFDFDWVYNETFNQFCDNTLEACLDRFMGEVIKPGLVLTEYPSLAPTTVPTLQPTDHPTIAPSEAPTIAPTSGSPTSAGGFDWFFPDPDGMGFPNPDGMGFPNADGVGVSLDVVQLFTWTNKTIHESTPISAQCMMTSSEDGTVATEMVKLRNLTLHIDEVGTTNQDQKEATNIFGMLLRLEFEDFGYMRGELMCDLYLNMTLFEEKFRDFATYDIFFMISREEFNSGTAPITNYIRSRKKVWRNQNELIHQKYSYTYEETKLDGKPDFTAEVNVVDERAWEDAFLNIEVYPYPTVVNYVSFDRYDYMDWIADIGGYYTIAFGIFFALSSRLTKAANRKDVFHRRQGILPAFSLPHRNAEEISGLRSLVLASLGISEKAYFSDNYDHYLQKKLDSVVRHKVNQVEL